MTIAVFPYSNRLEVSTPIWLTRVSCLSTSICLQSCKRCPISPVTNCIHSEDIEIKCGKHSAILTCTMTYFNSKQLLLSLEFINGSSVNTSLTSCGIRVTTISATTHDIRATPFRPGEYKQTNPCMHVQCLYYNIHAQFSTTRK